MFRRILCLVTMTLAADHAHGTQKQYVASEIKDDISGETIYSIAVMGEDRKSMIKVSVAEKKQPVLTIRPADTIFPDVTNANVKVMSVSLTMRSNLMDAPTTRAWAMAWMDYKSASTSLTTNEAESLLTGDSVTFQFDKVGKRYRFLTNSEGMDGFADALRGVLSHAATEAELKQQRETALEEAATKRVNQLLSEQEAENARLARTKTPSAEEIKQHFEQKEAIKNATIDGSKMASQIPRGVLNALSTTQIRSRAKKAADYRGIKKESDHRRASYIDAYVKAVENAKH